MNFLYYDAELNYPDYIDNYSPSVRYPEYTGKDISKTINPVYDSIRNIFREVGLDSENFGSDAWNPLGEYINPGDCVLLKPNLVLHKNNLRGYEESLDCLVTHPSVIRCVLDYVLIALNSEGKVYIGDSPVKDCNLPLLIEKHHYSIVKKYYENNEMISWVDLRGSEEESQIDSELTGVIVNIEKESYFYNYKNQDGLRIPNYDFHKVRAHHTKNIQEYNVNELVLKADVIINLPKPKTHRKSGYTGALKNFVGINYSKEYLPHHTAGDASHGGDEFLNQTLLKKVASNIRQTRDIVRNTSEKHMDSFLYKSLARIEGYVWRADRKLGGKKQDSIKEGAWFGNDTLWRTILDLNKVVYYADKSGVMYDTMQRKVIHLCDMVISGEKEGPLAPTPKKENILLFGDNAVELDALIVGLMHFRIDNLRTLSVALKEHFLDCEDPENILIKSNISDYNGRLGSMDFSRFGAFEPASEWGGLQKQNLGEMRNNNFFPFKKGYNRYHDPHFDSPMAGTVKFDYC